jgi:hypothetical protein
MAIRILEAVPTTGHRLHLRFNDGVNGEIDIGDETRFRGVFAALRDLDLFRRVYVDPEWGTVFWPGDLDLAPEPLWERVTGRKVGAK